MRPRDADLARAGETIPSLWDEVRGDHTRGTEEFLPYFGPPGVEPLDLVEQTFLTLLAGRKRSFASLRDVTPSERDYFARLWQLARAAVEARP